MGKYLTSDANLVGSHGLKRDILLVGISEALLLKSCEFNIK